jgi:prepilin-type N-terminal cleavage/methylation domain-containing protein
MQRFAKASSPRFAFTLIELLIVVAIIAILAAIAVPNFLEAQTRAKVSRVVSDMRSYNTGVEMYRIDHNKTPPTYRLAGQTRTWMSHYLTTPIAYINTAFLDVFNMIEKNPEDWVIIGWGPDYYLLNEPLFGKVFADYSEYADGSSLRRKNFFYIFSIGPDQKYDINTPVFGSLISTYDASNGTISRGDINRFNG